MDHENEPLMTDGMSRGQQRANNDEDDKPPEQVYKFETNGEDSEARDENFCSSLCIFCCPNLSIYQFIAIISILEFVVYIISLCIYGIANDAFLAPDQKALAIMGSADAKSTKNDYQFYRLIMPTFLHANLEHILGNVAFQLYLGSGIESGIGFVNMAFLYLVSEIGGVLLAITVHPESYGVGASCAGYGLVGFIASYVFTNWFYMGRQRKNLIFRFPFQRWYLLILFLFFFLINQGVSINPESQNIGHQGGFVTGIFIGLTISEQYDYRALEAGRTPDRYYEREWKERSWCRNCICARCGLVLLVLWFLTLTLVFYLHTDVDVEQG